MTRPPPSPMPDATTGLSPLKRAFLALEEAQARATALEQAAREPIAIIGVGCRVPGASGADAFWQLMRDGVDAISPVPRDRWDVDAYFDPDLAAPGKIATREGGFLSDVDRFDASFFGIAPREAQGMDPQQRLILEVAWEALEHAGQAADRLRQSPTGVYLGVCSSDYSYLQIKTGNESLLDAHFTSGIAHSITSGRLSYLLGLQGPSLTLDTACSSSLVAVHLAVQALRGGECRMALAGGVNLILAPDLFVALSHARMLAPDGRCKTFDAAADGFARGEGCGMVVLKRLSDALADGDRVLAIVRGTAVNQDGASSGLTAPNGPAQEAVIRGALANGGVAPHQVGYVEAHGTGTELGDPLEAHALGSVFADRRGAPPLVVGSVKTNIGHLEAAAGVVGLIKLVLALGHQAIPPHLHFETPSPHIDWARMPLRVAAQAEPWTAIENRRVGGVSSFGFSGTNAHVIVEEAPSAPTPVDQPQRTSLFALSARDSRALTDLAARYADALAGRADGEMADVCYTATHGRTQFTHRATIAARSMESLRDGLSALTRGEPANHLRTGEVTRRDPPTVAFLFTGQGSQYAGMARGLYEHAPAFREALDRCAEGLAPHIDVPLLELMFATDARTASLDDTVYTQPAIFALEYALSRLWHAWGVTPTMVIGHSVGELVAACVAGVFELDDALRLVARRGRLMGSLPPGGAMAAIAADEPTAMEALRPYAGRVSVAAINGPAQTVISGAAADVAAICRALEARAVKTQSLPVSHAFHSPLVEPILDAFEREVAQLRLSPPRIRLISNVTGAAAAAGVLTTPAYWRRHLREAVRFDDGLRALAALRPDVAIEIGPHPTLLAFAGGVFGNDGPLLRASLRKGHNDWDHLLQTLADVHLAGVAIDWRAQAETVGAPSRRVTDLPTYPFQRERHWFPATAAPAKPIAQPDGCRASGHVLLGTRIRSATAASIHEALVCADFPAFLRQHVVQGHIVLPGTAYLDTFLALSRTLGRREHLSVEDVVVSEAMLLPPSGERRIVQTVAEPADAGMYVATISSRAVDAAEEEPWTRHATARVRSAAGPAEHERVDLRELRQRLGLAVDVEAFYGQFASRDLELGISFRTVRSLWARSGEALGEVVLGENEAAERGGYIVHPVLLDGCLQVIAAALPRDVSADVLYVPIGIGRLTLQGTTQHCWSHVTIAPGVGDALHAEIRLLDAEGTVIGALQQVQLKRIGRDALAKLGERWMDEALYETRWIDAPLASTVSHSFAPQQLSEIAAAEVQPLATRAGIVEYDRFLFGLEALAADYVVQALADLGWSPAIGDRIDAAALADTLGIAPAHRRLFARLLSIVANTGALSRDAHDRDRWTVVQPLPPATPELALARLRAACPPDAEAELELVARTAGQLAPALRGRRDPLELLFPGGSLDTAERMYRDSPTARFYNGLIAHVIAAIAKRRGDGVLRILEVGGGTGGTTAHVLPRLAGEAVEYTFTDVGPLFVARAAARFATSAEARFEVLDLEKAPEDQGFGGRQFDLVIASNVVHATADLRRTMTRIRALMAPGGLLAMLEVTAPQNWFDVTVGLTPGWWAFADRELRPEYPTLSREGWLALLPQCGFDAAAALPEAGAVGDGALSKQALVLARASRHTAAGTWVVLADLQDIGVAVAERLRSRGERCLVVRPGAFERIDDEARVDVSAPGEINRLLDDLRTEGPIAGVVHCKGLDASAWESTSLEQLRQQQHDGVLSAMRVAQALVAQTPVPRLWLLTLGGAPVDDVRAEVTPVHGGLWGLSRTLQLEHPELRTVCIGLQPADSSSQASAVAAELEQSGIESQVALHRGRRRVARLARLRDAGSWRPPTDDASGWRLAPAVPGAFESLTKSPHRRRAPGPGEVEIAVEATALNFKDVLNVLGMYPGDPGPLGGECAGVVSAIGTGVTHVSPGDAVMAVAGGAFASHVIARAELVQARPANMSAAEGASFSIAYLTAEFCLSHLAGLRAGQRVLIHAGAGGVGMAAVRLALGAGAQVIATAGAEWKRDVLRAMGVEHVFDSRRPAFAGDVRTATKGRGVDVVLNSLSGDTIEASFSVLADGGTFLEIGKRGIKSPEWVEQLHRGLRYHIVDWGEVAAADPALIGRLYASLASRLRAGALVTLPRHVFNLEDAGAAFRFMAQARHVGKVVVRHSPSTSWSVRGDGTYLVTGGLSGLGLQVARWLGERGAGRLVLIGRRGVTAEAEPVLRMLRQAGTDVIAEALDVSDEAALDGLLTRVRRHGPPLRGVFHSAGVLAAAGLLQQDERRFATVFAPKVDGSYLLDRLTRSDPIDAFVLFSSMASVFGSAGQANHAAANSFIDALAQARTSRGLPALSINWGAWGDVGAATGHGVSDRLAELGIGIMSPTQGLQALHRLLLSGASQAMVTSIDWPAFRSGLTHAGIGPFLSEVLVGARPATERAPAPAKTADLRSRVLSAPQGRQRSILAGLVREAALRALGMDLAKAVDPRAPLGDLGLDSLLSVELRNTLGAALGASLPATLLFDYPTLETLTGYLADDVLELGGAADEPSLAQLQAGAELVGSIEELSDDEVERRLAERTGGRG